MKKTLLYLLSGIVLLGIGSCQKTKDSINQLVEFDIPYSTPITVAATVYTVGMPPVDITTPEIATNSSKIFSDNKTSADLISEIKMTKFNISTSGDNLDYLKSVTFYIKTANMGDVKVAEKTNIPAGTKSIAADLADVNVKEYIFKDKIQFRISVTFGGSVSSSQILTLDQTMHVKGTLIK